MTTTLRVVAGHLPGLAAGSGPPCLEMTANERGILLSRIGEEVRDRSTADQLWNFVK